MYFIGVSKILQQLGIIKPGYTKTAGTSSGALVSMLDHPGFMSHDDMVERLVKLSDQCRLERNCYKTLDQHMLREIPEMVKPANASKILNGKACIALTKVTANNTQQGTSICEFKDKQEVGWWEDDGRSTL